MYVCCKGCIGQMPGEIEKSTPRSSVQTKDFECECQVRLINHNVQLMIRIV